MKPPSRFLKHRKLFCVCCMFVGVTVLTATSLPSLHAAVADTTLQSTGMAALIPASSRTTAPDFKLTDIQGRTITLSQFRGKVVLLDFWAVDCGGCKVEIPWYIEFDRKYRDKGLALIGLDMYGESPEVIKSFMAKSGMTYPVAIGTDAIGDQFGLKEMPLTLLIDRTGRIAFAHAGIVDKAQFENDIQQLLR